MLLKRSEDCCSERSEWPDNLLEAHIKEKYSVSSSDSLRLIVLLPDFSSASFKGLLVASASENRLSHDETKVMENLPSWHRPKLPAQSRIMNNAMNAFLSIGAARYQNTTAVGATGCRKAAAGQFPGLSFPKKLLNAGRTQGRRSCRNLL